MTEHRSCPVWRKWTFWVLFDVASGEVSCDPGGFLAVLALFSSHFLTIRIHITIWTLSLGVYFGSMTGEFTHMHTNQSNVSLLAATVESARAAEFIDLAHQWSELCFEFVCVWGGGGYKALIQAGEQKQGAQPLSTVLKDDVPVMENRLFTALQHLDVLDYIKAMYRGNPSQGQSFCLIKLKLQSM